jgi:hypothetical protein
VGPVDGELLARGIHAGRVPLDAMVWSAGWAQWRLVSDYASELGLMPSREETRASSMLARVSDLVPMQLPSTDVQVQALRDCRTLNEAASKWLEQAVAVTEADCGWVHVFSRQAGGAMITLEGKGPRAAFGVGRTIDPADHALRAAREGRLVMSEPMAGVVGAAISARLVATGVTPISVLMVPVVVENQLLVMLELGKDDGWFSATVAAVVEQLSKDLGMFARKRRWHQG